MKAKIDDPFYRYPLFDSFLFVSREREGERVGERKKRETDLREAQRDGRNENSSNETTTENEGCLPHPMLLLLLR